MDDKNNKLRIDWFDGSVVEDRVTHSPNASRASSSRSNETDRNESYSEATSSKTQQPHEMERKLMGFKKLKEISDLEPDEIASILTSGTSFWDLLNSNLKDDFIVLTTKILTKSYLYLKSHPNAYMLANSMKFLFIPSKFLDTLTDYVSKLSSTRISDKRMNSIFWEDINSFYRNVLLLCENINDTDKKSVILNLLNVVIVSIDELKMSHMEQIPDSITKLALDQSNILTEELSNKTAPGPSSITQAGECAQNLTVENLSIKECNIFPTKEDLLGDAPNIKPNIINGAYTSVQHYLEIQFKLLREDCFGALRQGLAKYREKPDEKLENIRIHEKVKVLETYVTRTCVGHIIDLMWGKRLENTDASDDGPKPSKINKCEFMYGSLVMLTSDNFETLLFGTVVDSQLANGKVVISFHTPPTDSVYTETYLLVESDVFFEPYHRVLKVLQGFNDVPMKKYIVDVQKKTEHPSYATLETTYLYKNNSKTLSFRPLDSNWSNASQFGLDPDQLAAFKLALTREFAVIQGPPGTGKTFIGLKVATTLLRSLPYTGGPMLIVCFTNHALDQFLAGIIKEEKNVVRLGSRSKNAQLEDYTLKSWKLRSNKNNYSSRPLFAKVRDEQEVIFKQMMAIQSNINKCDTNILCYQEIKDGLGFKLDHCTEEYSDPLFTWLFFDVLHNKTKKNATGFCHSYMDDSIRTCFSLQNALNKIESIKNDIAVLKEKTSMIDKVFSECYTNKNKNKKHQLQIEQLEKIIEHFKKYKSSVGNNRKIIKVTDPYELSPEDRWIIYNRVVSKIKIVLMKPMIALQAQFNEKKEEFLQLETIMDAEAIRGARVIAATTTMAARRHELIRMLNASILIVEEAAEVLEAHVVASMTHKCKHVILIGDHKQLRPSTAQYMFAKENNLEISLFERLIMNKVHARTLTTQRRMRREFVHLLVPSIYEKLDSHPSVDDYPHVEGVGKDLFFSDHNFCEDKRPDTESSYSNTAEAKLCLSFANYLLLKKYKPHEITIITTYGKQIEIMNQIRSKHYKLLEDVLITTVDSYQGEENRIVILSLVRSNKDYNIGFLYTHNRVCVALSRAREGFYMFGNMGCLKSGIIWRTIYDKLTGLESIGTTPPLNEAYPDMEKVIASNKKEHQDCVWGDYHVTNDNLFRK